MRDMSRPGLIAAAGLLLAAALAALWTLGGFDWIAARAAAMQRDFQNGMAGTLRALKGGDAAAIGALLALSFGYGVAHAAGPGHGKFLIGGYGLGRRVPLGRLSAIALASSLAQATTAVVFVAAGALVFGWTRAQMAGVADHWLEPLSYGMIGLVGLWLFGRGVRHLRAAGAASEHGRHHDHHHDHDPDCGHAHLPTPEKMAEAATWRETAALIVSVAVRPCTGAIFVLILTFAMGLWAAGIAAAYAMGLGTATITVAVAAASATMREGALSALARSRALTVAMPLAEIIAGGGVAAIAASLVLRVI